MLSLSEPVKDANVVVPFMLPDQTCQRLTLAQIELATNNFDEELVIGRGGFGKVYKSLSNFGLLVSEVAIKRLHSTSSQGAHEFEAEVKLLSTLRHGNLVPLIGYCSEGKEMILAYEFMSNGTLDDHLHKGVTELSWLQRVKICIGAARGLDYLHTGTSTQHGVIHRDVKSSNILLDSNFDAKISDFGLAKVSTINQSRTFHVSTLVKGTFGYLDPCYFYSGKLTRKTDVYAFGVVLFEVLSGKQAVDETLDEDQCSLAVWAQRHFKEGRLNEIIYHRLVGQISKKGLKEFASLAVLCLHSQPKHRPTMAEVVVKLESILSRERESVGPIEDGRFLNKVRYLFKSKATLMPTHLEGSKAQISEEVVAAADTFNGDEFSTHSPGKIYEGSVDELTYSLTFPITSLDQLLFREPGTTSLSWAARLKIAVGAAHGLSFLHKKGHPAYSQFKTTCIVVDADYNARLWDFEVDKSFVTRGSYSFQNDAHYAAPEWFRYQADVKLEATSLAREREEGFGVKSEIYSFGVVLLEMLTGMKVFDRNRPQGKQNLVKWATPLLVHEVNLGMIVDPQLLQDNNYHPKGAYMLAELVSNCLQPLEDKRPSMEKILQVLNDII